MVTKRNLIIGPAVACSLLLAACGSSNKSTVSSTNAHHAAVPAKPRPISGVPSKPGAANLRAAGLKKLVVVPKHAGFSPHIAGVSGAPLTQAIPTIANDVNQFWSQEFAKSNVQYPQPQEALVLSSPVQNACGGNPISPTDPVSTCFLRSGGGVFYWTVPWVQQNIDRDSGRVDLAFWMASVMSMYVQYLSGSYQAEANGTLSKAQFAQQNTCLTGVYVSSVASRGLFEKADLNTATDWVNDLIGTPNGITAPDVSPSQLRSGFTAGFNSGNPGSCTVS